MAVLLAATLLSGCEIGHIQELEERAQEARSQIEVELQRRSELVPNLIETAQEYSTVPADIVEQVADARVWLAEAVRSRDLEKMEEASGALTEALERLLASAAGDRDLHNSVGFGLLRSQLEGTGQRIMAAGGDYNEAVRRFNEFIAAFPTSLTAKVIGAERLKTFDPAEKVSTQPGPTDDG
jgi:LemA protein